MHSCALINVQQYSEFHECSKNEFVHYSLSLVVPSASPTVISVVDITSNTAAMMWEPPLPEYQNGAIIGYLINVTLMETEQVYQLYTNDTDLTFDFLQPHDVYTVVIAAETTAGLGPFSTSLLFETKENGKDWRSII